MAYLTYIDSINHHFTLDLSSEPFIHSFKMNFYMINNFNLLHYITMYPHFLFIKEINHHLTFLTLQLIYMHVNGITNTSFTHHSFKN